MKIKRELRLRIRDMFKSDSFGHGFQIFETYEHQTIGVRFFDRNTDVKSPLNSAQMFKRRAGTFMIDILDHKTLKDYCTQYPTVILKTHEFTIQLYDEVGNLEGESDFNP